MKITVILLGLLMAVGCQDKSITPDSASVTEQPDRQLSPSQAAHILSTHVTAAGLQSRGVDLLSVDHVACTPDGATSNQLQQAVDLASPDFQLYGWQCTLVPRKGRKGRDEGFSIEAFKKKD